MERRVREAEEIALHRHAVVFVETLVIRSVSFKRVWRQSSFFAHTKSQL